VLLPVAAKPYLAKLNGPRAVAVAVSVAYVILCTVDDVGYCPAPNHPAVGSDGGGAAIKLTPPPVIVIPPVVIVIDILYPLYYNS
jgi:hypothetical protein